MKDTVTIPGETPFELDWMGRSIGAIFSETIEIFTETVSNVVVLTSLYLPSKRQIT